MGHRLDDIDRRIVKVLLEDGRISINELAAKINISRATAYNRFERLRTRGILNGFRANVAPAAVGLGLTVVVLVEFAQQDWPQSMKALGSLPGVEHVALTSGEYDAVLVVRVPDVQVLREVLLQRLADLEQVQATHTMMVLDEHREGLDLSLLG